MKKVQVKLKSIKQKENLSEETLKYLMGQNKQTFVRGKGGALRSK
ncbi:hypothetical protein [Geomicrobium sp. JCM 19038]|nr:hypothetical protein [Geomicrobium sp. JCM 19038]